jgi:hypothetical protein
MAMAQDRQARGVPTTRARSCAERGTHHVVKDETRNQRKVEPNVASRRHCLDLILRESCDVLDLVAVNLRIAQAPSMHVSTGSRRGS